MSGNKIKRDLPNDEYQAAIGANNASASNVFATINDLTGAGGIEHGVAAGTNTYTVAIPGVVSYTDGDSYVVRFTNGSDADSTININGLGAITLTKQPGIQVTGGDIIAGQEMILIYDGTNFQCIGVAPNQLFAYVTNDEAITITKGQPVYAFGATGNRMSVKLAFNTSDATSAQTVGVVYSSSIAANQRGFIIVQGVVGGLNTSMYAPGDQLYLGATAGSLTNVKPYAPNHLVYIGIVERANAGNGQIYVRTQNGYELDELHDVDLITTPPTDGQVLTFDSVTGLWRNESLPADVNIYNSDGTLTGNRTVTMNSNTLLFDGTNSDVKYTPNSAGGYLQLEGKASGVPRFSVSIPPYLTKPLAGFQLGMRAWDDATFPGYGKIGDAFFYAGNETNGLNFMNPVGTGTEDYIRFYAGNNALATSDIHIQGTGATRGNIGIGTETPTEKLEVSGKTKTTTFQMTTTPTAGYVLTSDASGNGTWQVGGSASGIFGIANTSGVYTFYSTITLAMAAAVSGQTIEMFADVTTGSNVSINLKNGVNINGNGHTYSYSNSLGNCFQDNGVSVTCQILNLTISRTSSLSSGANVLLTGSSRIDFTGSYIYRDVLTDNYACIEIQGAARVFNAYCLNEYGRGIWSTNANSLIENCFGQTIQNSGIGIMSHGNVIKSTGISVNLPGIDISSTNGLAIQCIGVSVSSIGIRGNTINCTGISTSGAGIGAQTVTTHRNSSAISSSFGAFSTGSSPVSCHNCTFETTSGSFGASSDGGQYHNCSISVLSGTGNGIVSPNRVVNCTVRVSSNSAFCLYSILNRTVNYASNVWIGTTTPISTVTITQGITTTEDNQGNILM